MKLIDLVNNVDKSENNECTGIRYDLESIINDLGYSPNNWSLSQPDDNIQLRCYWAANHICTDTWVGIRLYFLNDVFVALSTQNGRKCDEIIEWKDKESEMAVLDFIKSIDEPEEVPDFKPMNLDEDIGDGYPIEFTGQMLVKEVLYNGELVKVTYDNTEGYKNFHNIRVVGSDGVEKTIDVRDILVPWYLKKDLNSLVVIETPVAINSTLEVGDIVNHTKSNRNGVVYLVENSLVHVRFWDGGKHTFSVEGNDFKIMRKD